MWLIFFLVFFLLVGLTDAEAAETVTASMGLLQAVAGGLIGALIGYGLTKLSFKLFGPAVTLSLICAAVIICAAQAFK